MTAPEIAERFEAKPVGDEKWSARCPAHDDQHASLSVTAGEGGRTLLHCHAGCDIAAVLGAAGLKMRDLAGDAPKAQGHARIVAEYSYSDEPGAELFQVCRFEPKDFRQRHRDTAGAWIWKMAGVRRVLYRLPEVLAAVAAGATIYLVEGEKDADSLCKLGLVATCNVGGAGKWRSEYTDALRGAARVVVIADKDAPGRKHAAEVARSLTAACVSSRVVEVPTGKDASDWIAAGATRGDFEQLAEAAPDDDGPTPDEEAELAAAEAQEPPPHTDEDGAGPTCDHDHATESTLAENLIAEHGHDFRYVPEWKAWLAFSGGRWKQCATPGALQRHLIRLIRRRRGMAARRGDKEAVTALFRAEKRTSRDAIVALAAHEARVEISHEDLDLDPMLLNVRNGTIDLRTGALLAHRREDLITKIVPVEYDPNAQAPVLRAFLGQIFEKHGKPNEELIEFVQKAAGYSLTGTVTEQVFFILWGSGANGKSTLVEALLAASGDYGTAAADDLLILSKSERHPTELADLFGRRMVTCQETQERGKFDEARVKRLTGGDRIKARRMREDPWDFGPSHKLWLATNHRPSIRGTDHAIWRRLRLIPFLATFPDLKQDKDLPRKLRAELPGILNWIVEGCRLWREKGLAPPAEVVEATAEYKQTEDRFALFLEERCTTAGQNLQATAADVHGAFKAWAEENGEFPLNAKALSERLKERGFEPSKGAKGKRIWKGIKVLALSAGNGVADGGATSGSTHVARTQETKAEHVPPSATQERDLSFTDATANGAADYVEEVI